MQKKFTTILLESVFIFLAVFLSFLAEDYREEANLRSLEKESLEGIYQNMKSDSTEIKTTYNILSGIHLSGNLLLNMIDSGVLKKDSAEILFERLLIGYQSFSQNSHYEALKSSGNITEIKNTDLRNKLTNYYESDNKWIQLISEIYGGGHSKFVDDIKSFVRIRDSKSEYSFLEVKIIDEERMKNDPVWKNSLGETMGLLKVRKSMLKERKQDIQFLRQMIREELSNK
ncbi:hypothetical protein [Marivirga sp.]|uniref:hypothetical protein n=1 Tax=Marivirga sp. TaxID=2018662 RepID=UPI0025FACD2E|nr:hypothetical protein [Marivirga sp.]